MHPSEVIKVAIGRPFAEVYEFLVDPMNFPRWAAEPGSSIEPVGDGDYRVQLPRGESIIRFTPRNPYGVLDYQTFSSGEASGPVVPVRLYANGEGAELVLFWLKRAGVTDEQFRSDVEWISSDLNRLKSLIEGG